MNHFIEFMRNASLKVYDQYQYEIDKELFIFVG